MRPMNNHAFPAPGHDHAHCTGSVLAHAERVCASRGARLTPLRRDVLRCLAQGHQAVGAYEVMARLEAEQKAAPAPISIYRALDFLLAHGLVHKIESRNAYVACSQGHDDTSAVLLICEGCGMVAEIDAGAAVAALQAQAEARGFVPSRTVIELAGRCGHCAN
jgi:Fur family zinc uptake transcriptional regulator